MFIELDSRVAGKSESQSRVHSTTSSFFLVRCISHMKLMLDFGSAAASVPIKAAT